MDMDNYLWKWNEQKRQAAPDVNLDVWMIRSFDEGKTWCGRKRIFEGYCGALINMIKTATGEFVVPIQRLIRDPDRHAIVVYVSSDQDETWETSNIIDFGGHGHHDGALEPTIVEKRDGRLWLLVLTNFDQFWNAYSEDKGRSWLVLEPSSIDASSAPGQLLRLASGNLVLAWNRLRSKDGKTCPRRGGDGQLCMPMASWFQEELSIAFSRNDGKTWTDPQVILRIKGGGPSYPYIFEPDPGLLWVNSLFRYRLSMSLREMDFVRNRRGLAEHAAVDMMSG